MEGEQFSLCWNNFHNNLSSGFHTLLQDEDLVDVTLAAEGRYLKAHKTVLSVCSPYFKELFQVNPCKHPIVILHDVKYTALQNLLQFMYQGEVSVSQEEIPTFMKIAEMLKVKGLTDHARSGTNGFDTFKEAFDISEERQFSKRKPVMTNKRVIKPEQHLRPLEPPTQSLKSPTQHPRSSPSVYRRSSPSAQPVVKQPRLEEGDSSSSAPITPKEEPIYDEFDENDAYEDSSLDMSMMLDTTLGETSEMKPNNCFGGGSSKHPDTSSPGTLQCILGRRGNPRLIVDGHTFFKKSSYKSKCFWYCKFNRNHQFKCQATCWTRDGLIVKWPTGHSHDVVPERFNPDEDTMVPIHRFREVLIRAAQNY